MRHSDFLMKLLVLDREISLCLEVLVPQIFCAWALPEEKRHQDDILKTCCTNVAFHACVRARACNCDFVLLFVCVSVCLRASVCEFLRFQRRAAVHFDEYVAYSSDLLR